jgi:Flp pilus assembly protein CpaB
MRRGRILILLGLILAIATAGAVLVLLQSTAASQTGEEIKREDVVVASQPIAADESVEGRVELRAMPKESIPQGALRSLEATAGMYAAGPIPQGTILQPDLLVTPVQLMQQAALGKLVQQGYVAVAFPISELSSVSYGIQPSDHVDVLMSFSFTDIDQETQMLAPLCPPTCPATEGGTTSAIARDQLPRLAAQLTIQDAEVLGVGRWAYEPVPVDQQQGAQPAEGEAQPAVEPPQFITLMLTPQDALVLKLAREYGASIDLAVRAQDDHQQFTTQQVTLDYILARFAVTLPPRQPYTIGKAGAIQAAGTP